MQKRGSMGPWAIGELLRVFDKAKEEIAKILGIEPISIEAIFGAREWDEATGGSWPIIVRDGPARPLYRLSPAADVVEKAPSEPQERRAGRACDGQGVSGISREAATERADGAGGGLGSVVPRIRAVPAHVDADVQGEGEWPVAASVADRGRVVVNVSAIGFEDPGVARTFVSRILTAAGDIAAPPGETERLRRLFAAIQEKRTAGPDGGAPSIADAREALAWVSGTVLDMVVEFESDFPGLEVGELELVRTRNVLDGKELREVRPIVTMKQGSE